MEFSVQHEKARLYEEVLKEMINKHGDEFANLFSQFIALGMDSETAIFKCYNDLIVKRKK